MDISIVIPVYNVAPYIMDCLESVIQQTYTGEMECLIVDDCGTDESIAIAKQVIAKYKGQIIFRFITHEYNRGLSAARNTGLMHSKGDYVFYLDSDDIITEDCIEILMAAAIKDPTIELVQGMDMTCPDGAVVPEMEQIQTTHPLTNQEVRKYFFKYSRWRITAWNKLMKRSFILQHQLVFKEGVLFEDLLWTFYLMKYLSNVYFVSHITYLYRKRPLSILSGTDKNTAAVNYEIIYRDLINNLTLQYENEEFIYYTRSFAMDYRTFVRYNPNLKEIFKLFLRKAWLTHHYWLCMRLSVSFILGSKNAWSMRK